MSALSRICLRCRFRLTADTLASRRLFHSSLPRTIPNRENSLPTSSRGTDLPSSTTEPARPSPRRRSNAESITDSEVDLFLAERTEHRAHNESKSARPEVLGDGHLKKIESNYKRLLGGLEDELHKTVMVRRARPIGNGAFFEQRRVQMPEDVIGRMKVFAERMKLPSATHKVSEITADMKGTTVTVHGYIKGSVRKASKKMTFFHVHDFYSGTETTIQVGSIVSDGSALTLNAHEKIPNYHPFTPLSITGTVVEASKNGKVVPEIHLTSITALNNVSSDLIYTPGTVFPPEKRHLQLRTVPSLAAALRLRAKLASVARSYLDSLSFLEVETPLLFKSTPEGAREFLVPTRQRENGSGGYCYALPQSPQQYKQILMASGVPRYYQLAKCFRDEDLRADRQPEFTQLDLEMSFASGEDVMQVVEELLKRLFHEAGHDLGHRPFRRMEYGDAMKYYGSDKPDMRFSQSTIYRVDLQDGTKAVYAFKLALTGSAKEKKRLHDAFVEEHRPVDPEFVSFLSNGPQQQSLLSSEDVKLVSERVQAKKGDIIVVSTAHGYFQGGNTRLGLLRTSLINRALSADLFELPKNTFYPVWITKFPLFTPTSPDASEPGQSSLSSLTSTHHPFTAPLPQEIHLLPKSPLSVHAEHYDIVINGVELGGGSKRIHDPELQRFILEKVIRVHPGKIGQFDHLLEVLGSGAPPHAGLAIGWDRLVAMLSRKESIRDVVAFPKDGRGRDECVKAPGRVEEGMLEVYGLRRM